MTSAKKMQHVDVVAHDTHQADHQHSDFVFASRQSGGASAAHTEIEHIHDFAPEVDQLDLSDVAIRLGKTADETQAALRCLPFGDGTLLAVSVDNVDHSLVVIHGVTPQALEAAAPWAFEDLQTVAANTDVPLMLQPLDASQPVEKLPTLVLDDRLAIDSRATPAEADIAKADAFIFDGIADMGLPPRPAKAGQRMEISQLAEALGVSEMQVLEAIRVDDVPSGNDASVMQSEIETSDLTTVETLAL